MYNIIADLHTHTLASTHAYSTVQEMAVSAHEKGLLALALTDHARTMPGAPGPWFFTAMRELPLLYKGVPLRLRDGDPGVRPLPQARRDQFALV